MDRHPSAAEFDGYLQGMSRIMLRSIEPASVFGCSGAAAFLSFTLFGSGFGCPARLLFLSYSTWFSSYNAANTFTAVSTSMIDDSLALIGYPPHILHIM
jgi:hypothetical protein